MLGVVNEKALRELGWGRICGELEARARTPMGRERSRSRMPYDDPDAVRAKVNYVRLNRLGGVVIWELAADDGRLMRAIAGSH